MNKSKLLKSKSKRKNKKKYRGKDKGRERFNVMGKWKRN